MSVATVKNRTSSSRAPVSTPIRRSTNKKVIIEFPPELLRETDQAVHELAVNRSQLIRSALELFLRRRKEEKLERDLAESLRANAALDRRIMNEFKHVDGEPAI
jgi:Arc/MetJ-type ribon-helix-helix transcriptional regulator